MKDIVHFDILRKIIAAMTDEGWRSIPHVSFIYEADVGALLDFVKAGKENGTIDRELGLNTLLMRISAQALTKAPMLNAVFDYDKWLVKGTLRIKPGIDANAAWKMPGGRMMTFRFTDLAGRSLNDTSRYIKGMKQKIMTCDTTQPLFEIVSGNTLADLKRGRLIRTVGRLIGGLTGEGSIHPLRGQKRREYDNTPADMKITRSDMDKGSVTFSNIGKMSAGINGSMALIEIVPPQVFAMCFGAVQKRAVVVTSQDGSDTLAVGRIIPITVVFDHRAVDFDSVVPLLREFNSILADPSVMLSW